mmetsp:Transcript_27233/g.48942  ORF Transcript_27233/g.48942 Transcript_27233/m.48942 type:complete len:111 (-) Transcript_27233:28-360(-)
MSDHETTEEPKQVESPGQSKESRSGSIMRKGSDATSKSSKTVSLADDNVNPTTRNQRLENRIGRTSLRRSVESQGDIMLEYTFASMSTRRKETQYTDYNSAHTCRSCRVF